RLRRKGEVGCSWSSSRDDRSVCQPSGRYSSSISIFLQSELKESTVPKLDYDGCFINSLLFLVKSFAECYEAGNASLLSIDPLEGHYEAKGDSVVRSPRKAS